jgi:hypothetical protein
MKENNDAQPKEQSGNADPTRRARHNQQRNKLKPSRSRSFESSRKEAAALRPGAQHLYKVVRLRINTTEIDRASFRNPLDEQKTKRGQYG